MYKLVSFSLMVFAVIISWGIIFRIATALPTPALAIGSEVLQ
jgi:uncharacterized protein (DUF486 family)